MSSLLLQMEQLEKHACNLNGTDQLNMLLLSQITYVEEGKKINM